jgi:hypothetical protein
VKIEGLLVGLRRCRKPAYLSRCAEHVRKGDCSAAVRLGSGHDQHSPACDSVLGKFIDGCRSRLSLRLPCAAFRRCRRQGCCNSGVSGFLGLAQLAQSRHVLANLDGLPFDIRARAPALASRAREPDGRS